MEREPEGAKTACLIVTLDGPAASGKSSVAKVVAEMLEIPFVSSGLLYRAATFLTLEHGTDPEDERAIMALLERLPVRLELHVGAANRVYVNGEDISARLHTDAVDRHVSAVSRHPAVRAWVYRRLREIAGPFVIEGRDMGSVVFPEARYKFYLTAPVEVRAARRVGERQGALEEVAALLRRRDALDAKQLEPAEDAIFIDTSELSVAQVVEQVLRHVER
jgi:cytidylate kinase